MFTSCECRGAFYQNELLTMETAMVARPWDFTPDHFYAPGNIWHQDLMYQVDEQTGFYLVCQSHGNTYEGRRLVPCDMHGKPESARRTIPVPPANQACTGFLARYANGFKHPGLIKHNEQNMEKYLLEPDSVKLEKSLQQKLKNEETASQQQEFLESLSDLERRIYFFDWSFEESDAHNLDYSGLSRTRDGILDELHAMDEESAKKVWMKVGQHVHFYARRYLRSHLKDLFKKD